MVRFAAIAAVGLTLIGCSAVDGSSGGQEAGGGDNGVGRTSVPDSRPDITGIVTEVRHTPGKQPTSKRILVEQSPDGCSKGKLSQSCDKLYLDMTEKTRIFKKLRGEEEAFVQLRPTDLQRGQRVHAWHTGVLTKSYPGQGHARVIVVDTT